MAPASATPEGGEEVLSGMKQEALAAWKKAQGQGGGNNIFGCRRGDGHPFMRNLREWRG